MYLSREEVLGIYRGDYKRVRILCFNGLVVDLDADHLRQFTTEEGISGCFRLITTNNNRFIRMDKIDDDLYAYIDDDFDDDFQDDDD